MVDSPEVFPLSRAACAHAINALFLSLYRHPDDRGPLSDRPLVKSNGMWRGNGSATAARTQRSRW